MHLGHRQIKNLGTPVLTDDQQTLTIRATFSDNDTVDIAVPVLEVCDLLAYFAMLNQFLADHGVMRGRAAPMIGPFICSGWGFRAGDTASDTQLVLTLAACSMAFRIPNSDLARLGEKFATVARTLSADATKPN